MKYPKETRHAICDHAAECLLESGLSRSEIEKRLPKLSKDLLFLGHVYFADVEIEFKSAIEARDKAKRALSKLEKAREAVADLPILEISLLSTTNGHFLKKDVQNQTIDALDNMIRYLSEPSAFKAKAGSKGHMKFNGLAQDAATLIYKTSGKWPALTSRSTPDEYVGVFRDLVYSLMPEGEKRQPEEDGEGMWIKRSIEKAKANYSDEDQGT